MKTLGIFLSFSFLFVSCVSNDSLRPCRKFQKDYPYFKQGLGFQVHAEGPPSQDKTCLRTKKVSTIFGQQVQSEGNCDDGYQACLKNRFTPEVEGEENPRSVTYVQYLYDEADVNLLKEECQEDSNCQWFQ